MSTAHDARFPRLLRWLALVLLGLGIALLALGPVDQPANPTATLPNDADSTQVATNSSSDAANTALIVYRSDGDPLDLSALPTEGPARPNPEGTAAVEPRTVPEASASENADNVEALRADLNAALPDGVSASVTGPAAISADLASVFSGASFLLLGVTAAIVAVLLVVTYRSPILWVLPLFVVGVADRVAAVVATMVLAAFGMSWNESTLGILSVLVFGAGTNYALLLISRYRDELTRAEDRFVAMSRAWGPSVRAATLSALTVAVGVGCLVLSATPITRALGVASAVGVLIALLFVAFCLPGVLVTFGRWIFWPKRPQVGREQDPAFWNRIGRTVARSPLVITVASFVALLGVTFGATQAQTGIDQADQFIDTPESIAAAEELSELFPDSSATPATVTSPDLQATAAQLADAGFNVRPAEDSLTVSGGTVQELRAELSGTGALVGGPEAELIDAETYAAADRQLIFPLVIGLIFVSLALVLRSLVAPLIMVASVVLTNLSALGLGWWISHHLLGFDSFDSTVPLYSFVFLVALGVDYTIFLITRTRDEAVKLGTRRGVLAALSATGGVITSAGILLAAVFAALGVLPLVALAQIGVVICVGVLLDTLVVRTLLVPAVVQLLGERFWWPSKVSQA